MKVACLHPYLEGRREDVEKGLYPRHHLWGIDAIEKKKGWKVNTLSSSDLSIPTVLEKLLNRFLFRNSPGAKAEIQAWKASKTHDLIYSVCGPLSLARHYKCTKLVSWVFRKQVSTNGSRNHPYSSENLDSHSGFFCLTPNAQKDFEPHAKAIFLPWCVDQDMFDGGRPVQKVCSDFFLATGKTGRDYQTLVQGASSVNEELRIIGPKEERPNSLPPNIKWIDSSFDPPDKAIDYPTLREWYAQCLAVCIPLTGDAQDTCGYTNMLESMAMAKPVLMTSSGCLHLNPGKQRFGFSIEQGNHSDWACTMTKIANNPELAESLGQKGQKIAKNELSVPEFEQSVVNYIDEILKC